MRKQGVVAPIDTGQQKGPAAPRHASEGVATVARAHKRIDWRCQSLRNPDTLARIHSQRAPQCETGAAERSREAHLVWVPLHRELAVGALEFLFVRVPRDAEHFVKVALFHGTAHHLSPAGGVLTVLPPASCPVSGQKRTLMRHIA